MVPRNLSGLGFPPPLWWEHHRRGANNSNREDTSSFAGLLDLVLRGPDCELAEIAESKRSTRSLARKLLLRPGMCKISGHTCV